jgi:DNA end-binding protein Ku
MSASEEFHPEQYRDEVSERVRGLIQKKIEGEEITATTSEEPRAQVIDLMEALRRSLGAAPAKPAAAAPKKAATAEKPEEKAPAKAKAERKAPKQALREAPAPKVRKAR